MTGGPRRRRTWALAVLAVLVGVASGSAPATATAAAAPPTLALVRSPRDAIQLMAPTQIKRNQVYDVTVSGFARHRAKAYLFIDYQGCAKSFAAEQSRAAGESDTYAVKGSFAQTSGWQSSQIGTDHACAYLVSASGAVLATGKRAYPVS